VRITCPRCGGERIQMWLCHRSVGCTTQPRCDGIRLRQPPLPFEADYHAHRRCLDCGAEWASLELELDP